MQTTSAPFPRDEKTPQLMNDKTEQINQSRALWIAGIFTTVAFVSFGLSIYLNFAYPVWQMVVMAVIAGTSLAVDVTAIVLLFRKNPWLSLRLLYWSVLIVLPLNVLFFVGVTPVLVLLTISMGLVEVYLLFPPRQRRVYQFGPFGAAIVMGLIEWMQPSFRYALESLPTTGYFGQVIFGFLVVGIVILTIRQRIFLTEYLGNLSIALKMGLIAGVLVLGMAGIAISAYIGLNNLQKQSSNLYNSVLIPLTSIRQADTDWTNSEFFIAQLLRADLSAEARSTSLTQIQTNNTAAKSVVKRYETDWASSKRPDLISALQKAGKQNLLQEETQILTALQTSISAYEGSLAPYIAAANTGKRDLTAANLALVKLDAVHVQLHKLIDLNNELANLSNTQAQEAYRSSLLSGAGVLATGLFLGLFISYLIVMSITSRLTALTRAASDIQEGRMEHTAETSGRDEIAQLGSAFNKMAEQVRNSITNLEQRVAERTRALTATTEVSRRLSTIMDRDTLAKEVVNQLVTTFGYYYAHIYLLDKENNHLEMVGGTGEAGRIMLARGHAIPMGLGLVGRAAETNQIVLAPDVTKEAGWLPNELLPETKSEIAIPIALGNEVLGVFDVQHNVVNGLSEQDASLMQSIASQVAIALQNAKAYVEAQQSAERETLVSHISQQIQNTTTIEEALQVAVRELGLALKADRSAVQLSLQASPAGQNE